MRMLWFICGLVSSVADKVAIGSTSCRCSRHMLSMIMRTKLMRYIFRKLMRSLTLRTFVQRAPWAFGFTLS